MTRRVSALEWSILERFTTYVRSLVDGSVELLGPASWTDHATVAFPFDGTDEGGALRFSGGVRFVGHGGMLDVSVAELRLQISDPSFEITIVGDSPEDRFSLAVGAIAALRAGAPTALRLTEDGSDLFFRRYPSGHDLDPITLLLAAEIGQ
jgi:Htaa